MGEPQIRRRAAKIVPRDARPDAIGDRSLDHGFSPSVGKGKGSGGGEIRTAREDGRPVPAVGPSKEQRLLHSMLPPRNPFQTASSANPEQVFFLVS
ncbi:hypothetical protein [Paraburkholderia sp. MM6662-R1]|uniref:hypothetical protein n=1 Tax=Paraburkholderia sp. MM6662-R1 TaxID=2991066 RepID=UPI003D1B8925